MNIEPNGIRELDRLHVWHPYTRQSAVDAGLPVITHAQGIYLYGDDGRAYLDAVSSWWACSLGHGQPDVVKAIQDQSASLQHSILGHLVHPPAAKLGSRLAGLFRDTNRHVLFASDGASAVEAALKIAVQYWTNVGQPQRTGFASLVDAYHGDTIGAVSVGYMEGFHHALKPLMFDVARAEAPCCVSCIHGQTPEHCNLDCFASMRRILQERAQTLAAVIIEPLCQGAAGMRIYSPRYLTALAEECRRKNILLIVDEIAMGFGRTGKMFAFEHAGIDPDIVCVGKALSAGYLPISATIVRDPIYESFSDRAAENTLQHGHTFTGNPICAAAALATLDVYERDHIVTRAHATGLILAAELAALGNIPGVSHIRTLGMIGAFELGPDRGSGTAKARQVRQVLQDRGILLRPLGNVIYLMPPLTTPDDVIRNTVQALAEAIQSVTLCD